MTAASRVLRRLRNYLRSAGGALNAPTKRVELLEAKVAYLLDEVSGLRSLVRHIVSDHQGQTPIVGQTQASFDYQWRCLPEGHAMLSNPAFKARVANQICEYAALPADWFQNKTVMDAGSGQGRWTYGFGKLGVKRCVSCDISEGGLTRTAAIAAEFGERIQVVRKDIREDLGYDDEFDLVWCYGVLHHTGNTYLAFRNLAKCVKPGGYLFVMIYGEPRSDIPDDYLYYHEMFTVRNELRNRPFEQKVAILNERYGPELLHGYFDAISPAINDLYRWDELASWFVEAGFTDIKRTDPGPNHHVIGQRKA